MSASIVLALIIASIGCHRPSTCWLAAADLERFLRAMDLERGPVGLRETDVPLRDDLEDRTGTDQASIYVTPYRVRIAAPRDLRPGDRVLEEGCDVSELDACFGRLRKRIETSLIEDSLAARRSAAGLGPDPRKLYFVVDRAVRWDRMVPIVAAAHRAGFDVATFLFARTPATPPPPRTWVDDAFDRFDDFERLDGAYADEIGRVASAVLTCDSFKEGAHAGGDMPRSTYMILRAPQQVVECNCDLDLAALRSFMWHLLGTAHPVTLLDLTLTPSATKLELPAATPWWDASARLSARATWFVVADARR